MIIIEQSETTEATTQQEETTMLTSQATSGTQLVFSLWYFHA